MAHACIVAKHAHLRLVYLFRKTPTCCHLRLRHLGCRPRRANTAASKRRCTRTHKHFFESRSNALWFWYGAEGVQARLSDLTCAFSVHKALAERAASVFAYSPTVHDKLRTSTHSYPTILRMFPPQLDARHILVVLPCFGGIDKSQYCQLPASTHPCGRNRTLKRTVQLPGPSLRFELVDTRMNPS